MAYPRWTRSRNFKFASRSSGNVTLSNTAFGTVDSALDLAVEAQAGDVLQIGVSVQWGNEAAFSRLRVMTLVSGTPTNQTHGASTYGVVAWTGNNGAYANIGAPHMYTVVSGDVVSGVVTLRLQARIDSGGVAKALPANVDNPLHFWVRNLGPVQPN